MYVWGLLCLCAASGWAQESELVGQSGEPDGTHGRSPVGTLEVIGTVIALPNNLAFVVIPGADGETKRAYRLSEGDAVEGYRVAKIYPDRVYFERDGETFLVRVGGAAQPSDRLTPVTTHPRKGETSLQVVPPPANIGQIRRQTEELVERLRTNAEFRKGVDEATRRFLERQGRP
jgi:type II secretory pathway component PulC